MLNGIAYRTSIHEISHRELQVEPPDEFAQSIDYVRNSLVTFKARSVEQQQESRPEPSRYVHSPRSSVISSPFRPVQCVWRGLRLRTSLLIFLYKRFYQSLQRDSMCRLRCLNKRLPCWKELGVAIGRVKTPRSNKVALPKTTVSHHKLESSLLRAKRRK